MSRYLIITIMFSAIVLCTSRTYAASNVAPSTSVSTWTPSGAAVSVNPTATVVITNGTYSSASDPITSASVTSADFYVTTGSSCSSGTHVSGTPVFTANGTTSVTLTVPISSTYVPLTSGAGYSICLATGSSSIKTSHSQYVNGSSTTLTSTFTVATYVAPTTVTTNWSPSSTVKSTPNPTISVSVKDGTFNSGSDPVSSASLTAADFYVTTGSSCSAGTHVSNAPGSTHSGTSTTITASITSPPLTSGGTYSICLVTGPTGIQSNNGLSVNGVAATLTNTFTVYSFGTAPTVASFTPLNNSTSVTTPTLSATFTEPMDTSTLTTGWSSSTGPNIGLLDAGSPASATCPSATNPNGCWESITGLTFSTVSGNTVASFQPSSPLGSDAYYIVVNCGSTSGTGPGGCTGNGTVKNSGDYTSMSTLGQWQLVVENSPVSITAWTPFTSSSGTTFTNNKRPSITVKFSDDINSSSLTSSTFYLKNSAGTVITTNPITFNFVTMTAALPLFTPTSYSLADGVYTATVTAGVTDLESPAQAVTNAPFSWSFTVDTTAPVVSSYSPTNGATNLSTSTPITVTITDTNGYLQSSVNTSTFVVQDSLGNVVSGVFSFTPSTITFTPTSLVYNTTYTVTLAGITDPANNPIVATSWSFTTAAAAQSTYSIVPPFVTTSVVPNVLIILDNSNSFDEDMTGNAIGSTNCTPASNCSKSILARNALASIINTYSNNMNIGIMTYAQAAASSQALSNAFYFDSYNIKTYCPNPPINCYNYCVNDPTIGALTGVPGTAPLTAPATYVATGDEAICLSTCQAQNPSFLTNIRDAITTSIGSAAGSAERQQYCSNVYPKTSTYTDSSYTAYPMYYKFPGTCYGCSDAREFFYAPTYNTSQCSYSGSGYQNYDYCTAVSNPGNPTSYTGCGSTGLIPTDDDIGSGFLNFGQYMYTYYTSQSWYAGSSPGGGYLNAPIAANVPSTNAQVNNLLTLLGEGGNRSSSIAGYNSGWLGGSAYYMSCKNPNSPNTCVGSDNLPYIINAGDTPTGGTFQTALNYFNATTSSPFTSPSTTPATVSPITSRCQKNYIIFVTDGDPSTDESGTLNSAASLMPDVLAKITALRCPTGATNCSVKQTISGTAYTYDVKTYVLGVGILSSDETNLNSMAVAGGTAVNGLAYFANTATQLNNTLFTVFQNILADLSAGTAASILNNSQGSGENLLQAIFYPQQTFDNNTQSLWTGEVVNLWYYLDPFLQNTTVRADTVHDYELNLTQDQIAEYYFDLTQNKTMVNLYADANGDGVPDSTTPTSTVTPTCVTSLWRAGRTLWGRNLTSYPRAIYTHTDIGGLDSATTNLATWSSSSSGVNSTLASNSTFQSYLQSTNSTSALSLMNFIAGIDQSGFRSRQVYINNSCDPANATNSWKLGDVVSSTPKLISANPLGSYNLSAPYGYNDASYSAFVSSTSYTQRGLAFVGANDGMLHAFRLGLLKELNGQYLKAELLDPTSFQLATNASNLGWEEWAYIPKQVLPYLTYLTNSGYTHLYYVDKTPSLFDVSIGVPSGCSSDYSMCTEASNGSNWRTILIGGMGLGGATREPTDPCSVTTSCVKAPMSGIGLSGYFALDVTNPLSPNYLWEFYGNPTSPGTLGYSTAGPAIVRISADLLDVHGNATAIPDHTKNGKWFAVFVSGPTGYINTNNQTFTGVSDQQLYVFVVDVATGALVRTFTTFSNGSPLPANAFGGSINTGSAIDTQASNPASNGYYSDDAVYIGYVTENTSAGTWSNGGVIRLLTNNNINPANWNLSSVIQNIGPVTTAVTRIQDRGNSNLWLYFGTGRYFYKSDDPLTTSQQALYGVKEPCYSTADRNQRTPYAAIAGGTLNDLDPNCSDSVSGTLVNQTGSASSAPASTISKTAPGWMINLSQANSTTGFYSERVITDPTVTGSGAVYFVTLMPSSDPCTFGGDSLLWVVNYSTGGIPPAAATQGQALLQVSTGAFAQVSLASAFSQANLGYNGRRLANPITGVPPTAQGLTLITNPRPTKKILHIMEK